MCKQLRKLFSVISAFLVMAIVISCFNVNAKAEEINEKSVENIEVYANSVGAEATGQSTVSQTVKAGPSYSYYTDVGSISAGETIYVLGSVKNEGWYHIRYTVTSTGKYKSGYVPSHLVTNISGNVSTEIYTGGQYISNSQQTVWSSNVPGNRISIGTIYANEPITVLYYAPVQYNYSLYRIWYIEYSTSSGTKRGYLYDANIRSCPDTIVTSVARINNDASVYGGPNSSTCAIIGSVGKSEFVTVLAKMQDWVCIEYNTNNGRKRGFLSSGYLDYHRPGLTYSDFWDYGKTSPSGSSDKTTYLYAGPSTQYATIATINAYSTDVRYYGDSATESGWCYVRITNSNGKYVYGWFYRY